MSTLMRRFLKIQFFLGTTICLTAISQAAKAESYEDKVYWLAQAVYHEARGEPINGQVAVAQTILNRVKDPKFPNTVRGVVTDGTERGVRCDFSFYCDGKPDVITDKDAFAIAGLVATAVLHGGEPAAQLVACAHSYHATSVEGGSWFERLSLLRQVGSHKFYCDADQLKVS